MLDRALRPVVDPFLEFLTQPIEAKGLSANQVTWAGFAMGLLAMASASAGLFKLALIALLLNRLADGIDGCLARRRGVTDLGGYLDIVLDFIVYSGMVFAFALAIPEAALPASFLIFSFVGTGASFLAFAIFAAKRGLGEPAPSGIGPGGKGFYYLGGITEGTETILLFVFICLAPDRFAVAAYIFGALCWVTTAGRIGAAIRTLDR
jgi:phosphatidylglycerophosphate synthase